MNLIVLLSLTVPLLLIACGGGDSDEDVSQSVESTLTLITTDTTPTDDPTATNSENATTAPPTSAATVPAPTEPPEVGIPFEITQWKSYINTDGGGGQQIFVLGEIANTTDQYISWPTVVVNVTSADGTLLEFEDARNTVFLAPNTSTGFSASFFDLDNPESAVVEVEAADDDYQHNSVHTDSFSIVQADLELTANGTYVGIVGEVENIGDETVRNAWVYATGYNSSGEVVMFAYGAVDGSGFDPGDTGLFDITGIINGEIETVQYIVAGQTL